MQNGHHRHGEILESTLRLQSAPIAVKMLERENDIPPEALRPRKDHGQHYAQCQAFALSRRNGLTVAMCKEDHWCPGPVTAYGLVPRPTDPAARARNPYDCFEYGRYIGMVTAPLRSSSFIPDVIMIYCDTNQLRHMLLSLKDEERPAVKSNFFPFSCAFGVTSPMLRNEYWINLPDPGEYARALTQAGEMIFSLPLARLPGFVENLTAFYRDATFAKEQMMMRPDFPQPDLYKPIFKAWGMEYYGDQQH